MSMVILTRRDALPWDRRDRAGIANLSVSE
jgi:hypothetical protein